MKTTLDTWYTHDTWYFFKRSLRKLQLAQNAAARILPKTRKFEHITPILRELHWLPIRERIQFKLFILTWKSLNGITPEYLSNLLVPCRPTHALGSSARLFETIIY